VALRGFDGQIFASVAELDIIPAKSRLPKDNVESGHSAQH